MKFKLANSTIEADEIKYTQFIRRGYLSSKHGGAYMPIAVIKFKDGERLEIRLSDSSEVEEYNKIEKAILE